MRRRPLLRLPLVVVCAFGLLLSGCTTTPTPSPTPSVRATPHHDFFVDCGSTAVGTGTRGRPWATTAQIAEHGTFSPGDRILLRRGTTCFGRIVPAGSGTNGNPILLGAFGAGARPIVHGGGTADQTGAVQLTDQHDWVIQDLDVTNVDRIGPDNTMRAGILVANDSGGTLRGITVRDNRVRAVTSSPGYYSADPHSYGGIAVVVRGAAKAGDGAFDDLRIEDNTVDHVGRSGIVVWADGSGLTRVTNTSITGNTVRYADGDSIVVWGLDGAVIDHNVSEHGGYLPACPRCTSTAEHSANAGIWPVSSSHVLLRYNEVWGEGAAGGDGEGLDVDELTSDVTVEGNYVHDNAGGGVLICGGARATVRYNVLEHDLQGEIVFACPDQRDRVRIVNNTIALGAGLGAAVVRTVASKGTDQMLFANNIVINPDGGGYAWPSPVLGSHNLYWGTTTGSEPPDPGSIFDDPGLAQIGAGATGLDSALVYAPVAGSRAIGTGGDVGDDATTDYAGRPVDGLAPDRGALTPSDSPLPAVAARVGAALSGPDVRLAWPGAGGSAWQVLRSAGGGPFKAITGQLVSRGFNDVAAPRGALRYRVVAVDRNRVRSVGSARVR